MSNRLRQNNFDISTLRPLWARTVFEKLVRNMQGNNCDVVVYGNDRGFNADVLLRDTAFAMDIPTAVELLNLFIDPNMLPTALIAPSHYAGQHESILDSIQAAQSTTNRHSSSSRGGAWKEVVTPLPLIEVIPPSVDMTKFNKTNLLENAAAHHAAAINYHKDCVSINEFNKKYPPNNASRHGTAAAGEMRDCIHIGFIARLAPEKNPGLFIQFAAALLSDYYPLARFTVVGK